MIKGLHTCFIALTCCWGLSSAAQELKIPQPSTLQRITQDLGLGQVTIAYSRPNVKGRKVFDGMEPYGAVWRTGANSATVIKLTDTIKIEGQQVVPGTYALFTIPGAKEWTIILNQTANQWGAYAYDSTKDILRVKVKPVRLDQKTETLTIQFANAVVDHCELQIAWENTLVPVRLETIAESVDAHVMANIDQLMKGDNKPYYFAAIYYYNHDKDMKTALSWMQEVIKAQPDAYNVRYWMARIQLKMGDKQGATASATEGLKQATLEKDKEYIRLCNEVLAQIKS